MNSIELARRADNLKIDATLGLGDLPIIEVVDLVLAEMHPDLPRAIDAEPMG